ncbi:MAG: hypothetical protein KY476_25805 [Planctomycetes bacterium]|nr:hypothetical protein [Planctomycetota bacterium]
MFVIFTLPALGAFLLATGLYVVAEALGATDNLALGVGWGAAMLMDLSIRSSSQPESRPRSKSGKRRRRGPHPLWSPSVGGHVFWIPMWIIALICAVGSLVLHLTGHSEFSSQP